MAVKVIQNLAEEHKVDLSEIDYFILCTQSPDYQLPTTACIVQNKVGLNKQCGAIDINQGCSGYIYGLSLASSLVASGNLKMYFWLPRICILKLFIVMIKAT